MIALLLLFYTIMAGVFTFGKQAIIHTSPFFLSGIRLAGGGVCFLTYQYFFNYKQFYIKKTFIPYLTSYMVTIFFMDNLRLQALRCIPSSNAALIATTAPFIAAFFSWLWFKETFGLKKIGALMLGVAGMLPLLLSHLTTPKVEITSILLSYTAVFLSTIAFIICGILSKELITNKKMPFFMLVGSTMTGGGSIGLLFSLFFESWNPVPMSNFSEVLPVLLYLFITHSLIAFPLYSFLVQKYPITLVAFGQLSVPFLTGILSLIFFNEPIELPFFISLTFLAVSFWLFYREELRTGLIK